jgi:hypothetical protein
MWKAGSTHNFTFQSPLTISPNSKQYLWNSTTGLSTLQSDSITVSTSGSVVGNYKTQYYLTVTSPHDSPTPPSGWFNSGTSITESVTSPVSNGSGTQYICTGWTGTGSVPASGTTTTTTFTINATSSITWNWKTQYYLTVTSAYDSPSPVSGWFNSGTSINESVTSPVSGGSGTQYMCTGWTGTGSVPASGSASSLTFTINQPSKITWDWETQYYLTVTTRPPSLVTIPGEGWYNASASVSLTAPTVLDYNFINWIVDGSNVTGNPITVTMNAPHTATAYYQAVTSPSPAPTPVGGYAAPIEGSQLQAPSINLSLWIGLAFVFLAVIAAMAILIKRRNRILY